MTWQDSISQLSRIWSRVSIIIHSLFNCEVPCLQYNLYSTVWYPNVLGSLLDCVYNGQAFGLSFVSQCKSLLSFMFTGNTLSPASKLRCLCLYPGIQVTRYCISFQANKSRLPFVNYIFRVQTALCFLFRCTWATIMYQHWNWWMPETTGC